MIRAGNRVSSDSMKALKFLPCLLLAACGGDDRPNPHDTKYESFAVGDETCVTDTVTTLTWQVRDASGGLNDRSHTYSWYDPDEAVGELDYRGVENGGDCSGSKCDTWHYVQAVNEAGLCGFNDWRLPLRDELFSISDLTRAEQPPTINTDFFADALAAEYWSSNDYSFQYDAAWAWSFEFGHDRVDWKKAPKQLRLVRGTATVLGQVKE